MNSLISRLGALLVTTLFILLCIAKQGNAAPTNSLSAINSDTLKCGVELYPPAVFSVQKTTFTCGEYKMEQAYGVEMNDLSFDFHVKSGIPEDQRHMDILLYKKGVDDVLKNGWGQAIARKPDGTISAEIQMGEGCANLKKVAISKVSGKNWHGWVAENIYSSTKKKQADSGCEGINFNHRCIGILIGNKTMSAAMIGYCFLRESDQPLEGDDMEYDLFMRTIKNLRFKGN